MSTESLMKDAVLFKDWPEAQLRALSALTTTRNLSVGETLFDEGDASTAMYMLVQGTISIRKGSADQAVTNVGSGSHFGEMAMLTRDGTHERRSATALAVEPSHVLEISYAALAQIIAQSPPAGVAFYRNLAVSLAGRIRRTTEDLAGLRALRLRHV